MAIVYELISGSSTTSANDAKLQCINAAADKLAEWGFDLTVIDQDLIYFTLQISGQDPVYYVIKGIDAVHIRKAVPTANSYISDVNISNATSSSRVYSTFNYQQSSRTVDGTTHYECSIYVGYLETSHGDKFAYIGIGLMYPKIANFAVGYVNIKTMRRGDIQGYFCNLLADQYTIATTVHIIINYNGYLANVSVYLGNTSSASQSDVSSIILTDQALQFPLSNGTVGDVFRDYGIFKYIYRVEYTTLTLSSCTEYIINSDHYLTFGSMYFLAV